MPGVFLSALATDKFKTSVMGVTLLTQLEREHAYMDAVIPSVLRRGTVRHPDMASITRALEMMYGASAGPISLRIGEVKAMGFFATFPEGRFLPGGSGELESASQLLGELLTAPTRAAGCCCRRTSTAKRSSWPSAYAPAATTAWPTPWSG